jgi:hypothetical protein
MGTAEAVMAPDSSAPPRTDNEHAAETGAVETAACWRWAEDCGYAHELSRAIADLAAASSIAAVNVSVQAARAGTGTESLIHAADDLDRISAQTREAAQRLAELAMDLQTDITRTLEASWRQLELDDEESCPTGEAR